MRFSVAVAGPIAPMLVLLSTGCGVEPSAVSGNVVVQRYVLDGLALPTRPGQFADDLDGTGHGENQLAVVLAGLAAHGDDGSSTLPAMLARCAQLPVVGMPEAAAAPGVPDVHAGSVSFASALSAEAVDVLGFVDNGRFVSARARTAAAPVEVSLLLPIFADSDPLVLPVVGFEIELASDSSDDQPGYRGTVHGALHLDDTVLRALWQGLVQMVASRPADHVWLVAQLDENHDGAISFQEFAENPVVQTLLQPDAHLFAGSRWAPGASDVADSISLGLGVHLRACATGGCCPAP